ncbi:hypothetical protein GQ600_18306 [Phytophthora cactorum]|nr:hypothetical protein GQ600_18306 [Phytophthora cactorum]
MKACWPAVMKDTDGVILVYNPESHVHESEAMLWSNLAWTAHSAVFEHSMGSSNDAIPLASKSRLPSHLRVVATTFDTPTCLRASSVDLLLLLSSVQQRMGNRK